MRRHYCAKEVIFDFFKDLPPAAADALRRLDERLEHRDAPNKPYWVYLLAFARSQPFYIDTTNDPDKIYSLINVFMERQIPIVGAERVRASRLVWFDTFETESDAVQRCAEVRATPHQWQQRLVGEFNPDWIELDNYMIGFPFFSCVGETHKTMFKDLMHGPAYR